MFKRYATLFIPFLICFSCKAQKKPEATEVWRPVPPVVKFTNGKPDDAIILFDGSGMDLWEHSDGKTVQWDSDENGFTVSPGTGDIRTKAAFSDCQIHLEWRSPKEVKGEGQGRGNSGLFIQDKYEIQILDSYENSTYSNGMAGSIYKQYIPLSNATLPPGTWQTYDIFFTAPIFEGEKKVRSGRLTAIHNGILIHNNVEILGTTEYIGPPKNPVHGAAPLRLQDHGNLVSFRNIWVRKL